MLIILITKRYYHHYYFALSDGGLDCKTPWKIKLSTDYSFLESCQHLNGALLGVPPSSTPSKPNSNNPQLWRRNIHCFFHNNCMSIFFFFKNHCFIFVRSQFPLVENFHFFSIKEKLQNMLVKISRSHWHYILKCIPFLFQESLT